jgi:hypothetical protein
MGEYASRFNDLKEMMELMEIYRIKFPEGTR